MGVCWFLKDPSFIFESRWGVSVAKKVQIFIARYSFTGVPLAQSRLAKALSKRGFLVDFVVGFVPEGVDVPVIEGVHVHNLNAVRARSMLLPMVRCIKRFSPDIIFTAEDNLNVFVSLAAIIAGSNAKISASSRITPSLVYSNRLFSSGWILGLAQKLAMRRIDAATCVSKDMVHEYSSIFGSGRFNCVYNIVFDDDFLRKSSEKVGHDWFEDKSVPVVVAAGTLSPRKGFSDLINAIRLVRNEKEVRLVILGDGPLRESLQELIDNEGLNQSVLLMGHQDNPLKFFARSDVFVLSSYAEGLPNVLIEAMACGCTPVSTDCPTGPREILKNNEYGYLVPMGDSKSMASGILSALERPVSIDKLNEAVMPFTEQVVIDEHRSLLGI